MKIEDFDFATKQITNAHIECTIINRIDKTRFGIIIQANGTPPNQWVFDRFIEDKKLEKFFIDIESESLYDDKNVEKPSIDISINR